MSETWLSDHQLRNKKLGGCSRSSLNRYRKDPNFPEPRRYAGRNLTPESEIDLYLEREFAKQSSLREPATRNRQGRFAAPMPESATRRGNQRRIERGARESP